MTCIGCEGRPAPENNPCAVCGATMTTQPQALDPEVSEAAAWMYEQEGTMHLATKREGGYLFLVEDGWMETPLYPASALEAARESERAEVVAWIESLLPGQFEDVQEALTVVAAAISNLQHKGDR